MQVSVKRVNDVECQLTISVPAEVVEENYQKQINQLAKKANIRGFRPGKVPINYIKQRFSNEARREALEQVMRESFHQAIENEKLQPINAPRIEPKALENDKPLEFIVYFEVLPSIGTVNFNLDKIEKLAVEVTEKDVEQSLDFLSKQYADWEIVHRVAEEKDRVVVDYHIVNESDEPDLTNQTKDFPIELGAKRMIPGFEEGLIGKKAGEIVDLYLTYPEDYHDKEKAGKPAHFVVTLKEVFEAHLPVFDEAFLKRLGIASGKKEDLVHQIRQSLEQECRRLVKEKIKEQVFDQLLAANQIEVPSSLVDQEAKNVHDVAYPPNRKHDHLQHNPEELATFKDIAKKRVIISLLISAYAKKNDIKLDKDRVHKRIEEIASSYEQPAEVIQWLSSSEERRQNIEIQIMEDQVIDKLLEGVPEQIKTMSYAELKGIRL